MSKEFPKWARDYMLDWKGRLHLQAWTITPRLSSHPAGSDNNNGSCKAYPDVLHAIITMHSDIPKKKEKSDGVWEQTIIHELLHVSHAQVDGVFNNILSPELGNGAERMADRAYRAAMEPFIQNMAYVLWQLENEAV